MIPGENELTYGIEFIFDPIAKTAAIIHFSETVAVPGRFDSHNEAYAACLRVVRAKYVDAYTRA